MFKKLAHHWGLTQGVLFPALKTRYEFPVETERHRRLITLIETLRVDRFIQTYYGCVGRPLKDRSTIAHVFLAKAVYNITDTKFMRELLRTDYTLRRICGFINLRSIPSEATFSRAFAEFAQTELPQRIHESLIKEHYQEEIVYHSSRDATAIEARESVKIEAVEASQEVNKTIQVKKKRGRPKKGEERIQEKPLRRLEKQPSMALSHMLDDLPKGCDIGTKKNSKGFKISWKGYKLHIDVGDGDIPLSAVLTSASVHDSQVAIPLSTMTSARAKVCYELMDAAYDAHEIRGFIRSKGRVDLIDFNHRSPNDTRKFENFEAERYKQRNSAERVNSLLKDNYAGCGFHVRGHSKIAAHLLFSITCIAAEQMLRLISTIST